MQQHDHKKDLVYANDAVQEVKQHANHGLVYKSDAIDWKSMILVTVSDYIGLYRMHQGATKQNISRANRRNIKVKGHA